MAFGLNGPVFEAYCLTSSSGEERSALAAFTSWTPNRVEEVVENYGTSSEPSRVKTDATWGIIKPLGGRSGPHILASELVATQLARDWTSTRFVDTPNRQDCACQKERVSCPRCERIRVSSVSPPSAWC